MARRETCPTCTRQKKMTEHHIHPQRFFNGRGPKFKLCRDCHDELEDMIPQYTRLNTQEYMDILIAFIKFKKMVHCIRKDVSEIKNHGLVK